MDSRRQFSTDPAAMVHLRDVERTTRRMVASQYAGWSAADRDDLVSVVLEKYFKTWGRGPGPEPLGPWLKPVVRNAAIDIHRQEQAKPQKAAGLGNEGPEEEPGLLASLMDPRTPSLAVIGRLLAVQVLDELAKSYPKDRDLLRWRYMDDEPIDEIAKRTRQRVEAVKKALQRANARLNKVIDSNDDLKQAMRDAHPRVYRVE